jgi:hypothetical protein
MGPLRIFFSPLGQPGRSSSQTHLVRRSPGELRGFRVFFTSAIWSWGPRSKWSRFLPDLASGTPTALPWRASPVSSELVIEELRYNDAPLSASHTSNWVARRGGLPPMVRAIARALMRNGHSESGAISLAIGAVKRWARGGGKVHPSTRARAPTRAGAGRQGVRVRHVADATPSRPTAPSGNIVRGRLLGYLLHALFVHLTASRSSRVWASPNIRSGCHRWTQRGHA